MYWTVHIIIRQFSVPQIEYPLGGSSKKGSHVYFLLQVFWILFDINVDLVLPWWPDVTIVQSDVTIVVPWQLSKWSIHDNLFCYCPLVGILFKILRIDSMRTPYSLQWNTWSLSNHHHSRPQHHNSWSNQNDFWNL